MANRTTITITLSADTTNLPAAVFVQLAVRGLVSTTDCGEELLTALEGASVAHGAVTSPTARSHRSRDAVARALSEARGNLSLAAATLGCSRSTLRAAMERHGLTREAELTAWVEEGAKAPGQGRKAG